MDRSNDGKLTNLRNNIKSHVTMITFVKSSYRTGMGIP